MTISFYGSDMEIVFNLFHFVVDSSEEYKKKNALLHYIDEKFLFDFFKQKKKISMK